MNSSKYYDHNKTRSRTMSVLEANHIILKPHITEKTFEMVESGSGGSIAVVSSVTGLSGFSANPAYLSGKHGLIGLSRYVAVHYGRYGVRCNAVCPGALERTPNHEEHPDPQGRAARFEARVPLGRLGSPAEIAKALVFLSSDDASYINGACLTIDGGLSAA